MMADGMSSNVKGGAIMLLAVGAFSFMDAGMKVLSSAYPPLQIASFRSLASLPLILVWIGFRGGFRQVLRVRFGLHALRAAIGIVMLAAFVYGLRRLPLSEACATLLALPQWRPIQPQHWIAIATVGVSGCLGQWAITEAFRLGEASFLAPFEYSALVWGLALDWTLWQTLPEARALAGAAVIVASGIYLIRRERSGRTVVAPDAICE